MLDVRDIKTRPDYYIDNLTKRFRYYKYLILDVVEYYTMYCSLEEELNYNRSYKKKNGHILYKNGEHEFLKYWDEQEQIIKKQLEWYEMKYKSLLMRCPNLTEEKVPIWNPPEDDELIERFQYIYNTFK